MTLLNKKIFETVMNIKNFDLLQYNKLLSEFKKEDIFDTFISLYYNSSNEEQKNLLKAYYPIFISFELEKIEINNDSCFLIIDKYGTKNVTKYFNELLSISDNKEEIRKIINEVLLTKIDAKLDEMNSYERRIVHNIVSEYDFIISESFGETPHRYVVIKYVEGKE